MQHVFKCPSRMGLAFSCGVFLAASPDGRRTEEDAFQERGVEEGAKGIKEADGLRSQQGSTSVQWSCCVPKETLRHEIRGCEEFGGCEGMFERAGPEDVRLASSGRTLHRHPHHHSNIMAVEQFDDPVLTISGPLDVKWRPGVVELGGRVSNRRGY